MENNLLYGGRVKINRTPTGKYTVYLDGTRVPTNGVTTIGGIKDKSRALVPWANDLICQALIKIKESGEEITVEKILEARKLPETQKEEAANLGTKIHDWCENYILYKLGNGNMPDMPEDDNVLTGVNSFLEFIDQHKVEFISTEQIVYSLKYGFSGKLDIKARVDGKLAILDLKTSNGLYNGVRMQTAAYVKADEEEANFGLKKPKLKYETRWAVRIAKETEEEYKTRMAEKGKASYEPYKVFEAMEFADGLEEDFAAFLAAKELYEWDSRTDFWKLKMAAQKEEINQ